MRERGGAYELTDDAAELGTPASLLGALFCARRTRLRAQARAYANTYLCDDCNRAVTAAPGDCYNGQQRTNEQKRQCYTGKYKSTNVSSGSTGPDYQLSAGDAITPTDQHQEHDHHGHRRSGRQRQHGDPRRPAVGLASALAHAPFTEGAAYTDEKWVKAIVLLTDGENDVSEGGNGINESVYNAFGYAKNGHLGNTNGSNAKATLDNKTLTVCTAIKNVITDPDKAIRLYTIGFQVSSASQTLLKNCASKPDMFYNSPTNDQLAAIFQDIAQGLSELRIAQ